MAIPSLLAFCSAVSIQPRTKIATHSPSSTVRRRRGGMFGKEAATVTPATLPLQNLNFEWSTNTTPVFLMTDDSFTSVQLPKSLEEIRQQATENGIEGIRAGLPLIELNFPSVPNMATAALNQLLDANRDHTRQFIQACRTRTGLDSLEYYAVFPDRGELKIAAKSFAEARIKLCTFDTVADVVDMKGVIVVVQPGFNIDEWIRMEELQKFDMPIVTMNADLDKVRSPSYYPRLFYPGLHKVRTRFLLNFKEVYYIKFLSNGGTLLKLFQTPWTLFYKKNIIWQGTSDNERPEFRIVEKLLREAKETELLSSI